MKIYAEQLPQKLSKGLAPIYLLFGNEPLFKQEGIQQILSQAQQAGFSEIHRFSIDAQIQWQNVYDTCQSMSLFSFQQIIILTLPETPLNATHANALKEVFTLLHADVILILEGPKLTKQQENSKWFSTFSKQGLYIITNTPEQIHLPRFIRQRCHQLHLKPDDESIQLLALCHEGNLLALAQTLQKLQLLFPDGHLNLVRLKAVLSQHNQFTPFQLIDALLECKPKRVIRILRQLEAEGTEITILLRILQKELIQLTKMQASVSSGMPLNKIFDQYRVWQNRRKMISETLSRLPQLKLMSLLKSLAHIEVITKTDFNANPWSELHSLCLEICGIALSLAPHE